jgi:hypothetical protein
MIAMAASNLAETTLDAGDLDRAEQLNDESLAQAREIEFRPIIAIGLLNRALI